MSDTEYVIWLALGLIVLAYAAGWLNGWLRGQAISRPRPATCAGRCYSPSGATACVWCGGDAAANNRELGQDAASEGY